MNLKPKAAASWLAAPLVAMALIACGDDGGTSEPPLDGGPDTDTQEGECGDGTKNDGEECDNGEDNGAPGNDCSADCEEVEVEAKCGDGVQDPGETCDKGAGAGEPGNECTEKCQTDVHGDGHRGPDEECDDGNLIDDDSCTNEGKKPDAPVSCGNGKVEGDEQCDNGATNGVPGDDCTDNCRDNVCGDGHTGADEACDDGNKVGGDSCVECQEPVTPPRCGDGNEDTDDGEECDDGNKNGTLTSACTEACLDAVCGDGMVNNNEACDEGAENGTDGSNCAMGCTLDICGNGQEGPSEGCDDGNLEPSDDCDAECKPTGCGDSEINGDEACDNGDDNGTTGNDCTAGCELNTCGDGHVGGEEACDYGTGNAGNGSEGVNCTPECQNNECGDGYKQGDEACDDGADNNDAGPCTTLCELPTCGDGTLHDGETCDLGNANDNEGECTENCNEPACGDGYVQAGEECDDGNANSATAVDACRPITCTAASCGDGVLDGGEECDDGAENGPGKACTALCKESNCGDGIVQPDEDCDDENPDNTDSCLTTCQWNACGDGAVYVHKTDNGNTNAVEQCDDANDVEGDRCLVSCKYNICGDGTKLTDIASEPYIDPDFNGPMTASRCIDDEELGVDCDDDFEAADEDDYELAWRMIGLFEPTEYGTGAFDVSLLKVEECDDGNNTDTDSCRKTTVGGGLFQCLYNVCGDGQKYTTVTDASNPNTVEECDDANLVNSDSCIDTCKYNICGDGFAQANVTDSTEPGGTAGGDDEECDDGNALNTDYCTAACKENECGDGYLNAATEECDDGNAPGVGGASDICNGVEGVNGCRWSHLGCGDGEIDEQGRDNQNLDTGEECDDGNDVNTDSCTNTCHRPSCGDFILYTEVTSTVFTAAATELCDDGNSNNRDDCLATCAPASCGDGFVQNVASNPEGDYSGEACDLGSSNGGDACTAACQLADCGDGIVQTGEECDDANGTDTDGCVECKLNVCGDGFENDGVEACDDGEENGTSSSGCDSDCALNACHNPDLPGGDLECSDTNDINTDLCTNRCLIAICGDGIVSAVNNEECDDGNDEATDSCTNSCTWNIVGDGVRYVTKTDEGNPYELHNCDSGVLYSNHNNVDAEVDDQNLSAAARDDGFTDGSDFCNVVGDEDDENRTSELRCPSIDLGVTANPDRAWAAFIDAADTCVFALESYSISSGAEAGTNAASIDNETFTSSDMQWDAAAAACAGLGWGAKLVVINNTSITRAIVGNVVDAVYDDAEDDDDAWIGLIDRAKAPSTIADGPGSWFWTDSSQGPAVSDGTSWRAGEPSQESGVVDADQEDCGSLVFDEDTDEGGADIAQGWVYQDEVCNDDEDETPHVTIAVCSVACAAEGDCQ